MCSLTAARRYRLLFKVLRTVLSPLVIRVNGEGFGSRSRSSHPSQFPKHMCVEQEINQRSSSVSQNNLSVKPASIFLLSPLLSSPFTSKTYIMCGIESPIPNIAPCHSLIWVRSSEKKKKDPTPTDPRFQFFFSPFYSSGFKVSQEHYQAGPSRAETFHNPNLPADPSFAFNNCRHSLALLCDHAWMKSVKQLPELLGCLRLTFPQSKIYDLRARICHGNGSNLAP